MQFRLFPGFFMLYEIVPYDIEMLRKNRHAAEDFITEAACRRQRRSVAGFFAF